MVFFRRRSNTYAETDLGELITKYILYIETQPSDKVCLCVWEKSKISGVLRATPVQHNPRCPVHSKEGLILGFMQWLERHK